MPTILDNLTTLRALIARTPDSNVYLNSYTEVRDCGTLHCTLGWAAVSGLFPRISLEDGSPALDGAGRSYSGTAYDELFGPKSWQLFAAKLDSSLDGQVYEEGQTHKQLALARIDYRIMELQNV